MRAFRTLISAMTCTFMLMGLLVGALVVWIMSAPAAAADSGAGALPIVRTQDGLAATDVMINGEGPFRMIVDTAAATSSLRKDSLAGLNLSTGDIEWNVHGLIGVESAPAVAVKRLSAGPFSMSGHLIVLEERDAISDPAVKGIFGADLLASDADTHRYLLLDFHDQELRSGANLRSIGVPNTLHWTPMTSIGRDQSLLTFQIETGGVKGIGILDTGLTFAVVNRAMAKALSRSGRSVETRPYVDANGEEAFLDTMFIPGISGAGMRWSPSTVLVHDSPAIDWLEISDTPIMLVGLHHLRDAMVVVDRRNQRIAFGSRGEFARRETCTGSRISCASDLKSVVTQ